MRDFVTNLDANMIKSERFLVESPVEGRAMRFGAFVMHKENAP